MFEGDTVLFNAISLLVVIGIYLVYLRIGTKSLISGINFWIASIIIYVAALLITNYKGSVSSVLLLTFMNSSLTASSALMYLGLRKFNNMMTRKDILLSVILYVLSVPLLLGFSTLLPSVIGRTVVFAVFTGLFVILSINTILQAGDGGSLPDKMTLFFMTTYILFCVLRLVSVMFMPDSNILEPTNFLTILALIGLATSTGGFSLGLALMLVWHLKDRADKLAGEREILIRETHHRIKNNLSIIQSLLSLESNKHSDESSAKQSLLDCKNRISSIVNVHEMLYRQEDLNKNRLDLYLKNVAENVFGSYNLESVTLHYSGNPIEADINQLVPCGLIVNELISNACRHAFPDKKEGKIHMDLTSSQSPEKDNQIINIKIRDNGIGLSSISPKKKEAGFGLNMIQQLVNQMNGNFDVKNGTGTTYDITING